MRCTLATLALAAVAVANPVPQAVTSAISPSGSAPAGCQSSYNGIFEIEVIKAASKRDLAERDGALEITLADGVLKDSKGRTGYIAANNQFQFDGPPQAGAIYTSGWSVCPNGSLALGPDTTFYQCLSGTFYNLYDESTGAQCSPVYIDVIGAGAATPTSGGATQIPDGQVTASAVTQISDGQIQGPTGVACSEYKDGQPQCTTAAAVSQISDGQIQATTAAGAPVTQISDGQIQATTATPGCSEYVDGQPQCSAAATGVMPSYGSNTTIAQPTVSVVPATGAAPSNNFGNSILGLVAGVIAIAFL